MSGPPRPLAAGPARPGVPTLLALGLLVVLVNLPYLHGVYLDRRLAGDGVDVVAEVVDASTLTPSESTYVLQVRFDARTDPQQRTWTAQVDRSTYESATARDEVAARVLPGRPSVYRVAGQTQGSLDLVITLFADVVLVLLLLLAWGRWRRRGSGRLHLVAIEDVERARPGSSIEEVGAGRFVVVGEVSAIDATGLVLDVGPRRVRVELAGHANPVGHQQPARVTGRLRDAPGGPPRGGLTESGP